MRPFTAFRFVVIIGMLTALTVNLAAGGRSKSNEGEDAQRYLKQFHYAQKMGDLQSAATALVGYLSLDEDVHYLDTLMQVYILLGNQPAALAAGYRLMAKGQTSPVLLDRLAVIERQVGLLDSAMVRYMVLYQKTSDPIYAYELGELYYQKQDYVNMEKQLDKIFNDPQAIRKKVQMVIQQKPVDVPVVAAAYNLRGYYYLNKGNIDQAEADFKLSLKSAPDFLLPKNNLNVVVQVREQLKKRQQTQPMKGKPVKKKK